MNADPQIQTSVVEGPVAVAALDWPGPCGAEAMFVGRTREEDHPEFGPLKELDYEVYGPMAEALLRQAAEDAAAAHGALAVRVVHSCGMVAPGEASVVIQVATPHRAEAFVACRELIDRIKHELPVWKTEIWARGRTRVQGCCAHHPDDRKVVANDEIDEGVTP